MDRRSFFKFSAFAAIGAALPWRAKAQPSADALLASISRSEKRVLEPAISEMRREQLRTPSAVNQELLRVMERRIRTTERSVLLPSVGQTLRIRIPQRYTIRQHVQHGE